MTHAWCKSPARDAAVRAAEDGRDRPLQTLEEAIVRAFGFDEASAQRACDEVKSWPEDVQKDCRFFLGDSLEQGVERLQALVEAWRFGKGLLAARYPGMIPKSVSASSPVEQENKGDGMRTERVTLEITHDGKHGPVSTWPFECGSHGKGVRVVEEELSDAWAQRLARLTEERDEIRQSWLRSEESGTRLLAERNAALDAADGLRKRVAELEKRQQRSSFLSQHKEAYAYETMLDGWEIGSREWAESEPELHWIKLTAPENDNANGSEGDRSGAGGARGVGAGDHSVLDRDAGGGLEVEPAASGGGEGEPVAYFVKWADNDWGVQDQTFRTLQRAQDYIKDEKSEDEKPQIVPLYAAPPQPRGWLTEEERELIAGITDDDDYTDEGQNIAKELLARSTPPEVVLDAFPTDETGEFFSRRDVIKALAAAGVAVKEVGK